MIMDTRPGRGEGAQGRGRRRRPADTRLTAMHAYRRYARAGLRRGGSDHRSALVQPRAELRPSAATRPLLQVPAGRPLGKPNDAAYQRRVLDAAFELLDRQVRARAGDTSRMSSRARPTCRWPARCRPPRSLTARGPSTRRWACVRRTKAARGHRTHRRRQALRTGPDTRRRRRLRAYRRRRGAWQDLATLGVPRLVAQDVRGYYEEAAMALCRPRARR